MRACATDDLVKFYGFPNKQQRREGLTDGGGVPPKYVYYVVVNVCRRISPISFDPKQMGCVCCTMTGQNVGVVRIRCTTVTANVPGLD